MIDITKLIRKNILDLVPYSSARSEFKGKASVFLDANENPFDNYLEYNRYPDPLQIGLKSIISEKREIQKDEIFLSNGSDEAIDIIIRVFCEPGRDSILTFSPGFGMFKVAADINNVGFKSFSLDDNFELNLEEFSKEISNNVKVVFLCSPNNPTGNSIDGNTIEKLCSNSNAIVVVDEAYIHFSTFGSLIPQLKRHKNLIILQTLSKAYGGAGVRLGMAFADKQIIHYMNNVKMPYNISSINQLEAMALLKNEDQLEEMCMKIAKEKERMWKKLNSYLEIEKVFPSDANFFLIRIKNTQHVYNQLVNSGIIVRNLSSKKGCENCLRITVGTKNQNDTLYNTLDSLLNHS